MGRTGSSHGTPQGVIVSGKRGLFEETTALRILFTELKDLDPVDLWEGTGEKSLRRTIKIDQNLGGPEKNLCPAFWTRTLLERTF